MAVCGHESKIRRCVIDVGCVGEAIRYRTEKSRLDRPRSES